MIVLSWGAGIQSTALAVMSAKGILPRVDLVIHSDLENERQRTYEARDWYTAWLSRRGIAVEVVRPGPIAVRAAHKHVYIPFWTASGAPLRRECTREFKIRPIRRRLREIAGYPASLPPHPPAGLIEQWIGFSYDELSRCTPSDVAFIVNRWPLIEMRMTRNDCIEFLRGNSLPVPVKSSCIICPYRSASELICMRDEALDEFQLAIEFDEANRHPLGLIEVCQADDLFIYRQSATCPVPLAEAELEVKAARERLGVQLSLFV